MRVALLIQYDGTNYYGWQVQVDPHTVQGILEKALETVFGKPIGLVGSGRTDSGVHALGQVAHFDIEDSSIPDRSIWMAVNRHLPDDIRVIASQRVAADFHSRFAAKLRRYRYEVNLAQNVMRRNFQWYVRFPLIIEELHQAAGLILGTHDFSSFCYAGTETENMNCNISDATWQVESATHLSFHIQGDRFLHHMVRMLVGSMIEVARGKWEKDQFINLLDVPHRQAHAVTAPAKGLALMRVSYPEKFQLDWMVDQQRLASPVE